jgi:hypothetical protein
MASARSHLQQPLPRFDGFPYISTRVIPALYHIILLPADVVEAELVRLTRQQALANQLSSSLVLAHDRAIYCEPDGRTVLSDEPPWGGNTIAGGLVPAVDYDDGSEDFRARQQRLQTRSIARVAATSLATSPRAARRPARRKRNL